MATKYGSLKNSYWKAYMSYSTDSDSDSYTVTVFAAGPYASDGWVNYKFEMDLSATGKSTSSYGPWQSRIDHGGKHDFISSNKVYKFDKGISAATKTIKASVANKNTGSVSTATLTVTVPALAKYTISYNANGGSGAPGSQTKYYGKTLKLSSTKPERTGYTFKGWSKSSTGSVSFVSGASYTTNASDTLYAVWEANTYTVKLDANGGSGGIGSITKTYGQSVILPTSVPTRQNYNFKGWAPTANSTTSTWSAGGSYAENIASDVTLYAVWELAYIQPQISNLIATRMNSSGVMDDTGEYAKIRFDWKSGTNGQTSVMPTQIKMEMRESGTSGYKEIYKNTPTTTSGSITSGLIANVDTTKQYDVLVTIFDSIGSGSRSTYVSKAKFVIDVNQDGTGIAFGASCSRTDLSTSWNMYMDNNKALYCGGANKTSWYNMIGSNESNTFQFGSGGYDNSVGDTYYNGNTVKIRSRSGIDIWSEKNGVGISAGGPLTLIAGTDLELKSTGDISIFPKGGTTDYQLYYAAGKTMNYHITGACFIMSSGTSISFTIYFSRPIVNDATVTVSSYTNGGLKIRQNGKYVYGSTSTTYKKPSSYEVTSVNNNYVRVKANFTHTENAVTNDTCGLDWYGTIIFS